MLYGVTTSISRPDTYGVLFLGSCQGICLQLAYKKCAASETQHRPQEEIASVTLEILQNVWRIPFGRMRSDQWHTYRTAIVFEKAN